MYRRSTVFLGLLALAAQAWFIYTAFFLGNQAPECKRYRTLTFSVNSLLLVLFALGAHHISVELNAEVVERTARVLAGLPV